MQHVHAVLFSVICQLNFTELYQKIFVGRQWFCDANVFRRVYLKGVVTPFCQFYTH